MPPPLCPFPLIPCGRHGPGRVRCGNNDPSLSVPSRSVDNREAQGYRVRHLHELLC